MNSYYASSRSARVFTSGPRDLLSPSSRRAGDPSLRRKNGFVQDDAQAGPVLRLHRCQVSRRVRLKSALLKIQALSAGDGQNPEVDAKLRSVGRETWFPAWFSKRRDAISATRRKATPFSDARNCCKRSEGRRACSPPLQRLQGRGFPHRGWCTWEVGVHRAFQAASWR